jgi:hypothetical protein
VEVEHGNQAGTNGSELHQLVVGTTYSHQEVEVEEVQQILAGFQVVQVGGASYSTRNCKDQEMQEVVLHKEIQEDWNRNRWN